MNKYEVIKEDALNAYILDKELNEIVVVCNTKRPDLKFEKLETLVNKANIAEQSIELLKEFAFYWLDDSTDEHCARAVKVQEFLKNTPAAEWMIEQLRQSECDGCSEYEDCTNRDGTCGF